MQTITVVLLLLIGYFVLKNINTSNLESQGNTMRRQMALNEAKIYLAPYNNIWKNLRLSNKHCILKLGQDGYSIKAYDTNNTRSFRVIKSRVHSRNDLWDMFCVSFSHNTTFDMLVQQCEKFNVDIDLSGVKNSQQKTEKVIKSDTVKIDEVLQTSKEKLDINNASEVELTALPGISIVMSKKLIKKREEIGGFKTVNDVFLFLNIKSHLQAQLENLICVNKMKGSMKIKRYSERSIDL